jgi:hypothetical protein
LELSPFGSACSLLAKGLEAMILIDPRNNVYKGVVLFPSGY